MPDRLPHIRNFSRLPDETSILQRAAEGDEQAYGQLYTFYYPHLYTSLAFISRSHEDAQEIIHEVFLRIWKARESLMLIRSFEDYAYTLAKNLLLNHLKRKKTGRRVMDSLADEEVGQAGPAPDQALAFKQYYQAALAAINSLPEQKRRIFQLRTQEGLTLDEIAVETGISRSAVKKHLYAAIGFVKEYLRQHMGDVLLIIFFYLF